MFGKSNKNKGLRNPHLNALIQDNTPTAVYDMGALNKLLQENTHYSYRRVLRYRDDVGIIRPVVGAQVVSASPVGVSIYPDGPNSMQQLLIPWHRVWEFKYDSDDPIMNWNKPNA